MYCGAVYHLVLKHTLPLSNSFSLPLLKSRFNIFGKNAILLSCWVLKGEDWYTDLLSVSWTQCYTKEMFSFSKSKYWKLVSVQRKRQCRKTHFWVEGSLRFLLFGTKQPDPQEKQPDQKYIMTQASAHSVCLPAEQVITSDMWATLAKSTSAGELSITQC